MRIVFMGTPDFAVGTLQALVEAKKFEIVAVVTQPDRPKGRGKKVLQTPVKEYALSVGLPVYQPARVKTPEFTEQLRQLRPDFVVVAAFGQILSQELLDIPVHGCVNVHASLLPKYRGAAPLHYAILQGESKSGVTIMRMEAGMDTGGMYAKVEVPITENMTMGELHDICKRQGAQLLVSCLEPIANGSLQPVPQNEDEATKATLLKRSMEVIDWNKSAESVHNLIRAFNPAPGAFTVLPDGKTFKLWQSRLVEAPVLPETVGGIIRPGTVVVVTKKGFQVACGTGVLEVLEVQPESKKRMPAKVFCNGYGIVPGLSLGIKEQADHE